MEHIATFRGLNKGEIKTSGEKILEAIRRGAENTAPELPRSTRHHTQSTEDSEMAWDYYVDHFKSQAKNAADTK